MKPVEVFETLDRFSAAWPNRELQDMTVDLWTENLAPVDSGFGEAATNALIGESKYFPSIAEFIERAQTFAKHARLKSVPALPELPPGEQWSPISGKEAIEKIRKDLEEAKKAGPPIIHPKYAPEHRKVEYANNFHARKHFGPVGKCAECREFLPQPKAVPPTAEETA